MQARSATPIGAGQIPSPYTIYGAPSGFAPLTRNAGVVCEQYP